MDLIPSPVRRMIDRWVIEFDRVDAMERTQAISQSAWFALGWAPLCASLRECTPVYDLNILTQSGRHLLWPMALVDCDPQRVRTEVRIPESHIVAWRRRASHGGIIVVHLLQGNTG
jgi:hypothetical protein